MYFAKNIKKELFFKKICKNKYNKNIATFSSYSLSKKRLLLLIPENTGDKVFSVHKTKMLSEYREKKYKLFQKLNISNVSIF